MTDCHCLGPFICVVAHLLGGLLGWSWLLVVEGGERREEEEGSGVMGFCDP